MAQARDLALHSETEFEQKALGGFPVSCPTLDLSATWEQESKTLYVQRPPGQLVSKIHQYGRPGGKAPEALTVRWKPDGVFDLRRCLALHFLLANVFLAGQFLAVGWSDGVVRLMGLENNKAAHHIHVCDPAEASITHIGWASSNILSKPRTRLRQPQDERFQKSPLDADRSLSDMPRELTFLEVDTALPKISPLPSSTAGAGEDAMVFTLRTGIDFLFQPPKPEDYSQVNAMVVGTSNGKLQLSIYDSFVVGSFQCPLLGPSMSSQLIHHAFHPDVSTQLIALADKSTRPETVHLVPMDLPFISSSPINLSLLASKLTSLQKLLRYLKQTQLHMQVEWKNTKELPSRFLRSVQGDLENMERGPRDIVSALYHTAVTGHVYEPLREWLVESLAERGHKRWDKAVASGLEGLRSLVHENYLPALERCSIILSRLRGLAQFYDNNQDIGFTVAQINRVTGIISCLNLIGHKILVNVMDELEHFTVFSAWLRFQIDRLAGSNTASEDLTEKEATMDYSKVLKYIERYLSSSPLDAFFDEILPEDYTADRNHVEDGPSLLDVLDKQLKRRAEGQPCMKALPHVDFLVDYLISRSNMVFDNIAEAKKRSVRFGKPIPLSSGQAVAQMDMRVSNKSSRGGTIFAAVSYEDSPSTVNVFRVEMEIINGISSNGALVACRVDLGPRRLADIKFLNDKTLIFLCTEPDESSPAAVLVPVQSAQLPFAEYTAGKASETPSISVADFPEYRFPEGKVLRPVRMEIHDKSDVRGEIPARICLLGSNRTTLRSFAIPE
ncbi:hypothetical protein S7711_05744 [Stachybotrys chartarum IBT 7711]|uniref:Anaphase-promoting complex subunit 4 n=1 Tax=Stachybotrys chartarum (strain CBS 109288 / IBT 7711) TaxID=1280523 RepID=A0A084AVV1_STACB|nr:hypothetical protein S7711_05744 [Stachybotrys chartarum IBT 7711]